MRVIQCDAKTIFKVEGLERLPRAMNAPYLLCLETTIPRYPFDAFPPYKLIAKQWKRKLPKTAIKDHVLICLSPESFEIAKRNL